MKLSKLVAVAAVIGLSALSAAAQSGGQMTFTTFTTTPGNGTIFDVGGAAAGTTIEATVYTSSTLNGTYLPVVLSGGANANFSPVGDLLAGRVTEGQTGTSANVALGQNGFYEIRAWSASAGSTFEAASVVNGAHVGISTPIQNGNFGGGSPAVVGPNTDNFANFTLHTVVVPEPSTIALGIVGAVGLLALRRRRAAASAA